ncbi:MAG: hypothetical protein I4O48_00860, partial [Ralstonia sp.]|nr:hypothetical protein [Ralstonia sp.]
MQVTLSTSRAAIPPAAMTDLSQVPSPHDESKFVTFEGSPFQLYQPYPPAGDQP